MCAISARQAIKQRYGENARVSARAQVEEHKSGFERTAVIIPEGVNIFQVKVDSSYKFDIIPYVVSPGYGKESQGGNPYKEAGDVAYERTYYGHRGIGPNENFYICASRTAQLPCPICDDLKVLVRDSDPKDERIKKLIEALRPKERQLFNVRDHAALDRKNQIWDMSYHNFGKQLGDGIKGASADRGYEYFYDPDNGRSLAVYFKSKSFGSSKPFPEAGRIDFDQRQPLPEEWLMEVIDLDKLLIIPGLTRNSEGKIILTYERLKDIYLQTGASDDEGGSEDGPGETVTHQEKVVVTTQSVHTNGDQKPQQTQPTQSHPVQTQSAPVQQQTPPQETAASKGIVAKADVVHADLGPCMVVKVNDDQFTCTVMSQTDDSLHKNVPISKLRLSKAVASAQSQPQTNNDPHNTQDWGPVQTTQQPTTPTPVATQSEGPDWNEGWK